ncbi:hypothetical protein F5883DRAFT_439520 [Diaporthe sp. PMI_573]|nr:hypothetical protein F5883DRAFT_439520 [Diaporthaceae sp. PMI_573]
MADTSQASPAAAPFPHIRSCKLCRQRKVKCNCQHPCSHCARAGQTCLYPAGSGRVPKRLCRAKNLQLMDKLSRLENIIKRLVSESRDDAKGMPAADGHLEKHKVPARRSAKLEAKDRQVLLALSGESSRD